VLTFDVQEQKTQGLPVPQVKESSNRVLFVLDFSDQPTTVIPNLLPAFQVPTGVAGHHQQNVDEDPSLLKALRSGVKGGIKGGVKGGFHTARSSVPDATPESVIPILNDDLRSGVKGGIKGGIKGFKPFGSMTTSGPIRVTVESNGAPSEQPHFISSTSAPLVTEGYLKKTKNVKGGRKGYNYDVNNIRSLFSQDQTETPMTTLSSYDPQILYLPTERRQQETAIPTTEDYRQETVAPVQQTESPVQQTEIPIQQTEEPIQQTEEPIQQTEIPIQQTEEPIQQTEEPIQQTEEPIQQTEIPIQQTEEPIQQTEEPIQQTVAPVRETEPTTQRYYPTTLIPTTERFEPVQETQSPLEHQVTQRVELPTTVGYDDLQQATQLPEEPIHVTQVPIYTTPVPVTTVRDDFAGYPLGLKGRHRYNGEGAGKGKGKGSKGRKTVKQPQVTVSDQGVIGINKRSDMDPATPLLPSLIGRG